jgi:hypothetical protein
MQSEGSRRIYDEDGNFLIDENPITKVGVFEYSGAQIIADPSNPDRIDPNKIYKVFRPAEELCKKETIESFKLKPLIDEHATLGHEKGRITAAEKGVHGVIGDRVKFDPESGFLLGNLKIYAGGLPEKIDFEGKKEISAGYSCRFEKCSGVFDGVAYEFVQRDILGNHIALVQEGRSGHEVAVQDNLKFTFDAKELLKVDEEKKKMSAEEAEEKKVEDSEEKEIEDESDSDVENESDVEDEDEDDKEKKDVKDLAGLRLKNIADEKLFQRELQKEIRKAIRDEALKESQKFELAQKLSAHIGVFDHSSKTLEQVAQYAAKKLNLQCTTKDALPTIKGYLAAAKLDAPLKFAQDSANLNNPSCIDAYIKRNL